LSLKEKTEASQYLRRDHISLRAGLVMTKKTLGSVTLAKFCKHCLVNIVDTQEQGPLIGICRNCSSSLAIDFKKRKKLWKQQLRIFLNYKNKERPEVLVSYSGGTDSTLALYIAKQELKLNVIALMFDFGWERPEIKKKAEEFCSKYHIPLIRIQVSLKTMFLNCYGNVKKVSDKTIIDFPWCKLCGEGDSSLLWWGVEKVARLLRIERVITGNNVVSFKTPIVLEKNIKAKWQYFINKNNKCLNPARILGFTPNVMMINLPIACGYNNNTKMKMLHKIGFSLSEHYFRTPGSECHLASLLPCAQKLLYSSLIMPKASSYGEFLSGFLTREEWFEQVVKTNNFTNKDSRAAIEFIRYSLGVHTSNKAVSIMFNEVFFEKMRFLNKQSFENELIKQIKEYIYRLYYGFKKYKRVIKEVQQAIKFDNKNGAYYEILGESYYKTKQYKKAINALKKAEKLNSGQGVHRSSLIKCYLYSGQGKHVDKELRAALKKRKHSGF
jgi:tetratricopeptide (TPR) repeat protein